MAPTRESVLELVDRHIKAWCARSPDGVAASYTADATISINRGDAIIGHQDIADMVKGFCDDFPDVALRLDHCFVAGSHAIYVWTFTGTHAETGKKAEFQGWEEWELTAEPKVEASLGWYDAEDYERQIS